MELNPVEIRVLGCLVEKQRTTPDAYPLTLNALRLACNQSTNRDPVVDYDEPTVREAAQRLGRQRLARLASGQGSRATKYRHLLDETLGLAGDELALLAVLMLRGPQTLGELKIRSERLHGFADLAAVEATLERLDDRGLAARQERRPGQKELRYAHLLETEAETEAEAEAGASEAEAQTPIRAPWPEPRGDDVAERVARLEAEVREVRAALEALRRELGA